MQDPGVGIPSCSQGLGIKTGASQGQGDGLYSLRGQVSFNLRSPSFPFTPPSGWSQKEGALDSAQTSPHMYSMNLKSS